MPPRPSTQNRPQTNQSSLVDAERQILDSIKSKKESGILIRDIKQEMKLNDNVIKRSLDSLLAKKMIKEVVSVQNKRHKLFMAVEFEPSNDVTGGDWYENGELNQDLIRVLKQLCLRCMNAQRVSTLERIHEGVKKSGVLNCNISSQQIGEILNSMVLDNDVVEVKSTGYGDYRSIPIGAMCYRVASVASGAARGPRMGAFASIPCGTCPSIRLCTPDGVVSPATCVYYTKWLNIEF